MVKAQTALAGGDISLKEIVTLLFIIIIPIVLIIMYLRYSAAKVPDKVKDAIGDIITKENVDKVTDAIITAPFKLIAYGEDTADRVTRGIGTKSITGEDYTTQYREETYEEFVDKQGIALETLLRTSGAVQRIGDKLFGGDTMADYEELGEKFGGFLSQKGWFGY